jgi:hypothetical protein
MKKQIQILPNILQNGWQLFLQLIRTSVIVGGILLLSHGLSFHSPAIAATVRSDQISEVSPPSSIQNLRTESVIPKIKILSPKADEMLSNQTVTVRLQVENLKLFKDPQFELGPYLTVAVDNLPGEVIYDANTPIVLKDLQPGTHILRVFASRPWGESYKNPEAYAQVTFNIFTASNRNQWDQQQPLLTYNQPTGTIESEPILLDYYLATPKSSNPQDSLLKDNFQLRVTINGQSFKTDRWLPLYLSGFQSGTNWVRLELIDRKDQPLKGPFSEVTQAFQFQPQGRDGLAKLVQDQLSSDQLQQIVDPVTSQKAAKARERIIPVAPMPNMPKVPISPPKAESPKQPQTIPILPNVSTVPPTQKEEPIVQDLSPAAAPSLKESIPPKAATVKPKVVDDKPIPSASNFWERFKQKLPEPVKPQPSQQPSAPQQVEPPAAVLTTPVAVPTPSSLPSPSLPLPSPKTSPQVSNPTPTPKPVVPLPQKVKQDTSPGKEPVVSLDEAKQKVQNLWAQFKRSLPKGLPDGTKPAPVPPKTTKLPTSEPISSSSEAEILKPLEKLEQQAAEPQSLIIPAPSSSSEKVEINRPENTLPDFLKRFQAAKQQAQSSSVEIIP